MLFYTTKPKRTFSDVKEQSTTQCRTSPACIKDARRWEGWLCFLTQILIDAVRRIRVETGI